MENFSSFSISEAHCACVDAFASLLEAAVALPSDQRVWSVRAIQNAFDKYKVWAGNLGAMHSGRQWKKSLDYRLREASFYKVQVQYSSVISSGILPYMLTGLTAAWEPQKRSMYAFSSPLSDLEL